MVLDTFINYYYFFIYMVEKTPRQEARAFVGTGKLRDALESYGATISNEAIEKIVDACSFVFKV